MIMYSLATIYAGIAEIDVNKLVRKDQKIRDLGDPVSPVDNSFTSALIIPYTFVVDFLANSECLHINKLTEYSKDYFVSEFLSLPCVNVHMLHMVAACMHAHQTNMRFRNLCRRKSAAEIENHGNIMWTAMRNLILAFDHSVITEKGLEYFNISDEKTNSIRI
jgi:hypothetical protein